MTVLKDSSKIKIGIIGGDHGILISPERWREWALITQRHIYPDLEHLANEIKGL